MLSNGAYVLPATTASMMAPGSRPNTQLALYWKLAGWYQDGGLSKKSIPSSLVTHLTYSKKEQNDHPPLHPPLP